MQQMLRGEMDFMAPYKSYEPQCKQERSVYFTKKENKTITVKRILFCGPLIVQKPFWWKAATRWSAL